MDLFEQVLVEPINAIFPLLKKLLAKLTVKSAIGHIEAIQADITNKYITPKLRRHKK